ncbi:MAG TPA: NAD-dependent epimerase/dehydratase family protein [Candidatus Limnocylindria bacterium]|nr:NAD-dependent epimerase/dehydratase family protein [Candidatus Limnocylindria bacterium]
MTGGTGFIGSHLVEALLAQGHEVRCLVRDTRRLGWISGLPSVMLAQGGMDEPHSLEEGMRGVDQVYHVAGLTRARAAREFFRVNAEGTRHLVRACLETPGGPRRLVHLSSLAAVGPMPMATACAEDVPPRPVSPYGRSKLQGEAAVLGVRDRLHVTVLRPPVVYGPRDRGVLEVARWVGRGLLPMPAGPSRTLSLCYVEDLVTALLTAGEAKVPSGEIFHVASEGAFTWEQVGDALGEALGKHPTPLRIPVPILLALATGADALAWLTGRSSYFSRGRVREAAGHWLCDTGKARRQLGIVPRVGLRKGAAVTVNWYRETGWLR